MSSSTAMKRLLLPNNNNNNNPNYCNHYDEQQTFNHNNNNSKFINNGVLIQDHHHHQKEKTKRKSSSSELGELEKAQQLGSFVGLSAKSILLIMIHALVPELPKKKKNPIGEPGNGSESRWWSRPIGEVVVEMVTEHPLPCALLLSLIFFMGVEYTLSMVSPSSPPYDLGFQLTRALHACLAERPALNSGLAALNTVFVGMQTAYIVWVLLWEGRGRSAIAVLFMFTCRGILGYSTQLPLPKEFLGSSVDFPVGNVSFFLFFSGHVGASVIASIDMRRMKRWELARMFDFLNLLQVVRLLATRGHYTIDLAAGVGAGILFDSLAGKYEESRLIRHKTCNIFSTNQVN